MKTSSSVSMTEASKLAEAARNRRAEIRKSKVETKEAQSSSRKSATSTSVVGDTL